MCGIAGILGAGSDDPALVRRMTARLRHRGPDDETTHRQGHVALGHTRLAIIDRAGGHEPFLDDEGRALIYNGEIYNHQTLREQLEAQGTRFKTRSDGEVPLHLIAKNADPAQALKPLDGMFAFAHWDEEKNCLLLARDAYGIKPLFYTQTRDAFLFASEMKALLAHDDVEATLNPEAVREKTVFEYLLPGTSWLQGIHSVPPGHYLETNGQQTRIVRYHEPHSLHAGHTIQEAGKTIHAALERAVAKQLMSEVPLGVILSGGLDSSLIAALQDAISDQEVLTFSAAWDEENADFKAARRVAEHLGTRHHETLFTRHDMDRDLAELVWSIEDIDHETYFFHPLFRLTQKHATVTLCGQGADEVFGGYPRYHDLQELRQEIRARTQRAWPDEPGRHDDLLKTHYHDLHRLLAWERGAQLEQFQLRLVDRSSMAFSTETRVPFLDEEVVALGRGLPTRMLIDPPREKIALRAAARHVDLPRDIVERPKVPAGRRTGGDVIASFNHDAERAFDAPRTKAHPYGNLLEPPGLLLYELFKEIFVERRGEPPGDLHWNDLV